MLIDRAMLPLPEAAALIGVEARALVKDAIDRNLFLYAEIPADQRVLSVHSSHLTGSSGRSLASNAVEVQPIPPFAIAALQFLLIEPPSLYGLYNNGRDRVVHFEEGIGFGRDGRAHSSTASVHLEILSAFDVEEVPMPLRSFALYPLEFEPPWNNPVRLQRPTAINVTWDNVYVQRIDIVRLARQTTSRTAAVLKRIESWEGRYISSRLSGLRNLFLTKLKSGSLEHLRMLPRETLEVILKEQFAFSGSQAKAGAMVFLRSMDALYHAEQHAAENRLAILTLFECAEKFWGNADSDTASHPSLDEIIPWLQSNLVITDTSAKSCAAMIRPDLVSKGGRRKKPAQE